MVTVGLRRVALGTIVGGVVWGIWSTLINMVVLSSKYEEAKLHRLLLPEPRYPRFVVFWIVTLFLLTYILNRVYLWARGPLGPGPVTALRVGLLLGFVMGFPLSLSLASWATFSRAIVLGWMLDLWVGAILATLVSAWLYKES